MASPLLYLTLVATSLAACGDVRVSATPSQEPPLIYKTDSTVCTEDPLQIGRYSKIMFIVDKSGSNAFGDFGYGATDPDLQNGKRITAIRDFFEKNKTNKHTKWGFIVFHGETAESYIPEQQGTNRLFTNDPAVFQQAMHRFSNESDNEDTPYRAPIQLSTAAVHAELKTDQLDGISANFNLIFITDGMPTDRISDKEFWSSAEDLANLSPGNVHFSTVYYGAANVKAQKLLEKAAESGLGNYQDTNVDPLINIEHLLEGGTTSEPYSIKDFIVYNLNAANCDDGTVGADSDADGLCDKDEDKYNLELSKDSLMRARMGGKKFDATNRNSFHQAISDAIYYRYIAYNENIYKECTDSKDEDFDFINNCEEKYLYNEKPNGPTPEWTAEMNQGDKHANPHYFDSDGDGILDGLAYLFFRDKSAAMNYQNHFKPVNQKMKGDLFKNHQNPLNPNSELGYGIQFNKVAPNSQGQNCYTYHQDQLPLYFNKAVTPLRSSGSADLAHEANENVFLIYYIQTPENSPDSRGYLRYSFQKLKKDFSGLRNLSVDTSRFAIWPKPPSPFF